MTYSEVVKKAQKTIKERKNYEAGNLKLSSCDIWQDGEEINLWTYWQGYQLKDVEKKGVDILLVGLDWGNPDMKKNIKVKEAIEKIQNGDPEAKYPAGGATDNRLARMFEGSFGYKIMDKNPGARLFFTNYSLGYRRGDKSESGDNSKTLLKMDKELFEDLVSAIKPKIIICLGQLPYEMVSGTVTKDFVKHLKEGEPFREPYYKDKNIIVYGVSHTGSRGLYNMDSEVKMLEPWKRIADEYKKKK